MSKKLSKAEQNNAKVLLDDLCLVKEWVDKNIVSGGQPVPARKAYEALKGQLSKPMSQSSFAVSFSANARLGTLGNIKGMRPRGYVRLNGTSTHVKAEEVDAAAATVRAPESKPLKRSVALPKPEPEFNAVAAAPRLGLVQRPPTPKADKNIDAPAAALPMGRKSHETPVLKRAAKPEPEPEPEPEQPMEPVEAKPQVGPEPKAKPQTAEEKSKAIRTIVESIGGGPAPNPQKSERSHARHVWVGRKLYRVRGTFRTLYDVVVNVLHGGPKEDGEVVFDGKRFGGFDTELFERIIYYTLHAWQESADSEPVLDDGSGIPVELRIE